MTKFFESVLAGFRAVFTVIDDLLAKVFGFVWHHVRETWDFIRPTRFSAFTLIAGGFLLVATDQGQELAVRMGDAGGVFGGAMIVFLFAVGWYAFQAWYWARISYAFEFGHDHRSRDWRVAWMPRLYAAFAFVFAALALELVGLRGHAVVVLVVGGVFVAILVVRMRIAAAIASSARLKPSERVIDAFKGHERPETFRDLAHASRFTLVLSTAFALLTLVAIMVWPVGVGQALGAAAIAFLAFGHIVPVGSAIVIRSRETGIPIITTLLLWAFVISFLADNHRVPVVADTVGISERPGVPEAAEAWRLATEGSVPDGTARPVVFVATAGGGLRAAYWTAVVLGALQGECPGFDRHLFSVSGVSGGSVGAAVYATALHHDMGATSARLCGAPQRADKGVAAQTLGVLENEFLGPTFAAMFYPDLVQRFVPIPYFPDRGAALAGAWNAAWNDVCDRDGRCKAGAGDLDSAFLTVAGLPREGAPWRPILLLNGTHQETGKRLIASNVAVTADVFLDVFDLHDFVQHDVSMGMAALNSARFTYVSPAGRLVRATDGEEMGHVLDGGYFENYGAVSSAEIARAAVKTFEDAGMAVRPIVIQISSDPDLAGRDLPEATEGFLSFREDEGDRVHWFANEVAGPVRGILNTRTARGVLANKTISDVVESLTTEIHRFPTVVDPVFVHFRMCADEDGRKPPLGWAMSRESRAHLEGLIRAGCDDARRDNAEALARVLEALRTPVPVDCRPVDELDVTRCAPRQP